MRPYPGYGHAHNAGSSRSPRYPHGIGHAICPHSGLTTPSTPPSHFDPAHQGPPLRSGHDHYAGPTLPPSPEMLVHIPCPALRAGPSGPGMTHARHQQAPSTLALPGHVETCWPRPLAAAFSAVGFWAAEAGPACCCSTWSPGCTSRVGDPAPREMEEWPGLQRLDSPSSSSACHRQGSYTLESPSWFLERLLGRVHLGQPSLGMDPESLRRSQESYYSQNQEPGSSLRLFLGALHVFWGDWIGHEQTSFRVRRFGEWPRQTGHATGLMGRGPWSTPAPSGRCVCVSMHMYVLCANLCDPSLSFTWSWSPWPVTHRGLWT